MLFIGDSFTYAKQVATGSAYYDHFAQAHPDADVWAAGLAGYGSTQQALMLELVMDEVRPQVIVWQTLANDIEVNNVPELDAASIYRAPTRPRPFLDLDSGEVTVMPEPYVVISTSHLARRLYKTFYRAGIARRSGWVERVDRTFAPDPDRRSQLEARSLRVLHHHLREAMAAHPTVRFVGFSGDTRKESELREVFEEAGATWLPNVGEQVHAHGPVTCAPADHHWNHLGHKVAGELLAELLDPAGSRP